MATKFSVPEISCDHCKSTIVNTLSGVENIESVDVDVQTNVTLESSEDRI